jgi:hypothetical protein
VYGGQNDKMALDHHKISAHKQQLQVGSTGYFYAELSDGIVWALQTLADMPASASSASSASSPSTASLQTEMDQLRKQLASTQAERDGLRGERDHIKEQLESSDRANTAVSLCMFTGTRYLYYAQCLTSQLTDDVQSLRASNTRVRKGS